MKAKENPKSNKKQVPLVDKKKENRSNTDDQKLRDAGAGEIQYGHTIGRHGTDEEKNLNPEE